MTNINSAVQTEPIWASRLGASCLRVSFPGMTAPAAGYGTGLSTAVALAVPRVRGKVAFVAPPQRKDAVAALLGQTNIHNYMTGVSAVGEGASGPPRDKEPV